MSSRVSATGASLSCRDRDYSPAALTAAVEQMTAQYRALGLGASDVVVLRLHLSDRYVIALLAAVELGCCVAPVDIATPPVVIEAIIAAAAPAAIVDDDGIAVVDGRGSKPSRSSDDAFILFTSGSTGAPKGVVGTRRGLDARIDWAVRAFFSPDVERCAIKTNPAFIDSLTEILGAYRSGRTMVVAPVLAQRDPGLLAEFIRTTRIEQVTLTPSCIPALNAMGAAALATVRRWILTGEELRGSWLVTLRALCPLAQVINSYGSTEVCGDAIFHTVPAGVPAPDVVPIGRAAPGVHVFLDGDAAGLPDGAAELWVGGDQVARGYLVSGQSAESDRFRRTPEGLCWFRTGDIVRRSGELLYFLGRRGDVEQVRGRRVDLIAVADALESIDGVDAAIAWVTGHQDGPSMVRAAVIPRPGAHPTASTVRDDIRERVLPQLVPDRIDIVTRFCRTSSGKIDPAATVGGAQDTELDRSRFATGLQYLIASVVSAAVADTRIEPTTSFADLGLNSLLAVQVAEEIARHSGTRVTGLDVLAAATVEKLAVRIPGLRPHVTRGPVRLARAGSADRVLILLHPAIGTCLAYFPLVGQLRFEGRILYVEQDDRARAVLDDAGMDALARYYAVEVAAQVTDAPVDVFGYSFGALLAPAVARYLRDLGKQVSSMTLVDPAWVRSSERIDEDLVLRRVLTDSGYRDLPEHPLGITDALRLVRAASGPLRLVSAETIRRWADCLRLNMIHGVGYEPGQLTVDTLVVRATATADLLGVDAQWLETVLTEATTVTMDCTHFEVLHGDAAERLAASLSTFLSHGGLREH
ncbi:AMP-binding protein [Nocardia caishijiensis]|uniref:Acyl-CoA synthetase (AMP-forming)/AMP-acid ligase II n=1 Tax=Nocardia caishijiensis TaxID=184756 RepID=A0ABQ6YHJ8_9NOCA|nr:AMP-binding protein [Nocardia caishijiensis]KAF0845264.1 acyl-CoA synthetase (AMP-forming)/AMP-acid ligase II [Nocardia caishijiensis]